MTNQDYWNNIVGDKSPEEFLRIYGTADPELGLERFLEDRGHLYGVINQGTWATTFTVEQQHQVLTAQIYLRSYLEETREDWESALEAKPPKVVRRYRPVYDFPIPGPAVADEKDGTEKVSGPSDAPTVTQESTETTPDKAQQSVEPANDDENTKSAPESEQSAIEPEATA